MLVFGLNCSGSSPDFGVSTEQLGPGRNLPNTPIYRCEFSFSNFRFQFVWIHTHVWVTRTKHRAETPQGRKGLAWLTLLGRLQVVMAGKNEWPREFVFAGSRL